MELTEETLVLLLGLDWLLALDCDVVELTEDALDEDDDWLDGELALD